MTFGTLSALVFQFLCTRVFLFFWFFFLPVYWEYSYPGIFLKAQVYISMFAFVFCLIEKGKPSLLEKSHRPIY